MAEVSGPNGGEGMATVLRRFLSVIGVTWMLTLTACGPVAGSTVSEEEARRVIGQAVEHALTGRFADLCGMASARRMCESQLESGLREVAPKEAPTFVCARALPEVRNGETVQRGGQIVVLTGKDRTGRRFTTDLFIYHDGRRLVIHNTVWWSGFGLRREMPDGKGEMSEGCSAGQRGVTIVSGNSDRPLIA